MYEREDVQYFRMYERVYKDMCKVYEKEIVWKRDRYPTREGENSVRQYGRV